MFNSGILDVLIGLTIIYIQMSLVCTAINEMISAMLRKRAHDLEYGIRMLLNDKGGKLGFFQRIKSRYRKVEDENAATLTGNFYSHPLITALRPNGKTPSYIPARTFALTLIDLIRNPPMTKTPPAPLATGGTGKPPTDAQLVLQDLQNKIKAAAGNAGDTAQNLLTPELLKAVSVLIEDAGNNLDKARANIETWFNDSMDRVSGWYKRKSQIVIFLIAAFTTVFANVDTIRIADSLSSNKSLRDSLVAAAPALAERSSKETPTPTPTLTPTPGATPPPTGDEPAQPPGGGSGSGGQPPGKVNGGDSGDDPSLSKRIDDIGDALAKLEEYDLPIGWIEPCQPMPAPTSTPTPAPGVAPSPSPVPSPVGCKENFSEADIPRRYPGLSTNPAEPYSMSVLGQFRLHWLGWLLTAMAISLGAPFWFDLLNRLMVIRSTVKPHEKSREQGSKDETIGDDDQDDKTKGKT